MANDEHLRILNQGVEVWNSWRSGITKRKPDLVGVHLSGANLHHVNLSDANLTGSVLSHSNLKNALLEGANLDGAIISHADLTDANITDANLTSVTLKGAILFRTNFRGAFLRRANFRKASMDKTIFANNDLSSAGELETVKHFGFSELSISTFYKSKGNIPHSFMIGCGVPENFINSVPSLIEAPRPIKFKSCFISYSRKDQEFADRLYADLQSKGVRCWFAPHDLRIGDSFRDRIDESIRSHDKLLLIFSENSVESKWVGDEVESALEHEQKEGRTVLFPIRLDKVVMDTKIGWAASIRRTRHLGDFTEWRIPEFYKEAFNRLLRDLKDESN